MTLSASMCTKSSDLVNDTLVTDPLGEMRVAHPYLKFVSVRSRGLIAPAGHAQLLTGYVNHVRNVMLIIASDSGIFAPGYRRKEIKYSLFLTDTTCTFDLFGLKVFIAQS